MKTITPIDFVARRSVPGTGLALLALAALALAWQGWLTWQDQRMLQHQREAFATLTHQADAPPRVVSAEERRQLAQIAQLSRHLAAPWDELLALFEKHGAGDVALVRLEPDASTGLVNLTARARHRRVMMAYLLALESDPRLSAVLLTHHETLPDVEGTPVQFSITAQWRPGSPQRGKTATQEMAQ